VIASTQSGVALAGVDPTRLRNALEKASAALLAERNERGFWEGELSSSALSTATAVTALTLAVKHGAFPQSSILNPQSSIHTGLRWLADHQNSDGGWGDTTKSLSNISTTTLCWAAFGAAEADKQFEPAVSAAERWLNVPPASCREETLSNSVSVDSSALSRGKMPAARSLPSTIIARYGKDRTFSVPILTMCALAGRFGAGREAWRDVIPLPFELAALPHQLFAALRLPVVSYALPALVAIGLARHVSAPSRNPAARWIRNATRGKALRVLTEIQPGNGGFLEATPLTSFVTMSLVASGFAQHIVAQRGLDFLLKSQRADGSWPIDTNLSTWCTTLAIEALPQSSIPIPQSSIDWLIKQQYRAEHPYTHAAPGGWAWTDLPGGVPDADDTSGALLALAKMRNAECGGTNEEIARAGEAGIRWLLDLQNRDGGIPTFCRGWGALPFDRSSADITAHVLRAWLAWLPKMPFEMQARLGKAIANGRAFLIGSSRRNRFWVPLWFGNQWNEDETNPTYGTSRVVLALAEMVIRAGENPNLDDCRLLNGAFAWFQATQNDDGGWGGSRVISSVEETALAVVAIAAIYRSKSARSNAVLVLKPEPLTRGVNWLISHVESGAWREPSPIGFYFAKLWYFEKLYPMIFTAGALRAVSELASTPDL